MVIKLLSRRWCLLTNDNKLAELAKHLSTTAKVNHPWNFYHDKIGWNDRLPNINAALGASQIENISERLNIKKVYTIGIYSVLKILKILKL